MRWKQNTCLLIDSELFVCTDREILDLLSLLKYSYKRLSCCQFIPFQTDLTTFSLLINFPRKEICTSSITDKIGHHSVRPKTFTLACHCSYTAPNPLPLRFPNLQSSQRFTWGLYRIRRRCNPSICIHQWPLNVFIVSQNLRPQSLRTLR